MKNKNIKFSLFAILLFSSMLFPSVQLTYAEVPSSIGPEDIVIVTDEQSINNLVIETGGQLLIQNDGDLTITGNLVNRGTVTIDGIYKHTGFIFNFGSIIIQCGIIDSESNFSFIGTPIGNAECTDSSNESFENNLVIEASDTVVVQSNQILTLTGNTIIRGSLINTGEIVNLSRATLEGGILRNIGLFTNICTNFGISGISGDGSIQNTGIIASTICIAPVAQDDSYFIDEDNILNVDEIVFPGVLDNDADLDTDHSKLTASTTTETNNGGAIFINSDGTFQYVPKDNFFGIDSFEYMVEDGTGGSDTGLVTIVVNAVNDTPQANNDSLSINESESQIDIASLVLSNDYDVDSLDTLSIISAEDTTSAIGNVIVGSLIYETNSQFDSLNIGDTAIDTFDYTISDGTEQSSALVSITINGENNTPEVNDDNFTLNQSEDNSFEAPGVLLNDFDVDNNHSLTLSLLSQPVSGLVTINDDGSFDYISQSDFFGITSFEYQVIDEHGAISDTATVTLEIIQTIFPDTEPPTIIAPDSIIAEATGENTIVNLGTATVSDIVDPNPAVSNDAPSTFQIGTTTVTWTATDSSGNSANSIQLVTVQDTTLPTIDAPSDVTTETTESEVPISQIDLGTATVSDIVDPNPAVSNDAPSTFQIGTTTVTWTATDSSGNSANSIQLVTVIDISDNLRDDKLELIEQLEELTLQAQDKKSIKELGKAIKSIIKSTDEKAWEDDGNHLTPDDGDKVFKKEKKGIKHILKVLEKGKESSTFLLELSYIVTGLIEIDEGLSLNAFIKAEQSSEDFDSKKAQNEFDKAQKDIDKMKFDKAIDHFLKSWQVSLGIDKHKK